MVCDAIEEREKMFPNRGSNKCGVEATRRDARMPARHPCVAGGWALSREQQVLGSWWRQLARTRGDRGVGGRVPGLWWSSCRIPMRSADCDLLSMRSRFLLAAFIALFIVAIIGILLFLNRTADT